MNKRGRMVFPIKEQEYTKSKKASLSQRKREEGGT